MLMFACYSVFDYIFIFVFNKDEESCSQPFNSLAGDNVKLMMYTRDTNKTQ